MRHPTSSELKWELNWQSWAKSGRLPSLLYDGESCVSSTDPHWRQVVVVSGGGLGWMSAAPYCQCPRNANKLEYVTLTLCQRALWKLGTSLYPYIFWSRIFHRCSFRPAFSSPTISTPAFLSHMVSQHSGWCRWSVAKRLEPCVNVFGRQCNLACTSCQTDLCYFHFVFLKNYVFAVISTYIVN